jgi:REP-associated tyrosine transposase
VQSFQITRRNLPHWQEPGRVYLITWRCKGQQTLSPEERAVVLETLRYWDDNKWKVFAAVILSDHVHVLAKALPNPGGGFFDLGEILHSAKSYSAQKISQHRGSRGSIWQDERDDRIVRDEAEFLEKWSYIRNNPVKVGLVERPEEYPWLYERQS